jgi:diaminopimelate decarboxylase
MVNGKLGVTSVENALRSALRSGMIRAEDTAAIFYDLSFLELRIRHLVESFPPGTLHGLAIKANPLTRIMKFVKGISPSVGVEAASMGEVTLALKCGYAPGQIVYDSPVKTIRELEFAVKTGICINVDNLSELSRIKGILDALPGSHVPSGYVGLRINPQVGVGSILESSVAGEYSKFGVPVKQQREEIEHAFLTLPWLTGMHLHVGSQGCPVKLLTDGIGVLHDLAMVLNEKRRDAGLPPISRFDIGGGLPIAYDAASAPPSVAEYAAEITRRAPGLDRMNLITEFGRWVYTNSGWTVSRVEYVKREKNLNTAMLHVGADLFVRECLNPKDWQHEYSVFDRDGNIKTGKDGNPYNLAGPLCFSGDIIAKNVCLPGIEEGDYVVIHDTGGYTFSMWSRYNSRQTPRIIGYQEDRFEILKERESLEELHGFWE